MRSLALKAHKQAPAPLLQGLSAREKEAGKLFPQRGRFAAADIFRISQHLNLETELAEALGLVQNLCRMHPCTFFVQLPPALV